MANATVRQIPKEVLEICDQITAAVEVVVNRFQRAGGHLLDKKDPKIFPVQEGPVQDSEFGMTLLLARDWLRERGRLRGVLGDSNRVAGIVLTLLRRVLARVLGLDKEHEDVDDRGANLVYFSGSPYATSVGGRTGAITSYENIDAVSLIVSFVVSASESIGETVQSTPHEFKGKLPFGPALVDAARYVVAQGTKYLVDSAIVGSDRKCMGWYHCPLSGRGEPAKDNDRLFFTWTVSETVEDLRRTLGPEGQSLLTGSSEGESIRTDIDKLVRLRQEAIAWCRNTFQRDLLEAPQQDAGRLLSEVLEGKNKATEREKYDELSGYVQRVYHLVQFGAILSFDPNGLTLELVDRICTEIDRIVIEDVLGSGLDRSKDPRVYPALTRVYNIGPKTATPYYDDAFYPLVVRSFAALLLRSLDSLIARPDIAKADVLRIARENRRILGGHVNNLLKRRPEPLEKGDESLWTFAIDAGYVFYATQRTIFALTYYCEFLEKLEALDATGVPPTAPPSSFREAFMRELGAFLEPFADALEKSAGEHSSGATALHRLPDWARQVVDPWIMQLADDFDKKKIAQMVGELVDKWFAVVAQMEKRPPVDKAPSKLEENVNRLHQLIREIEQTEGIGPAMSRMKTQDHRDELIAAVFEHSFRAFLKGDSTSWDSLRECPLWVDVNGIDQALKSLKHLEDQRAQRAE